MSHHTWVVKKDGGPVVLEMFVDDQKLAIAGIARLRRGQETWIEPVIDIEVFSEASADLDFVDDADVNDGFPLSIRGISASDGETAPIHIEVKQDGSIVPAIKDGSTINKPETPGDPYTSVLIMKAPKLEKGAVFAIETFGVAVTS